MQMSGKPSCYDSKQQQYFLRNVECFKILLPAPMLPFLQKPDPPHANDLPGNCLDAIFDSKSCRAPMAAGASLDAELAELQQQRARLQQELQLLEQGKNECPQ